MLAEDPPPPPALVPVPRAITLPVCVVPVLLVSVWAACPRRLGAQPGPAGDGPVPSVASAHGRAFNGPFK